jgi:phosphonate transport system substrate-binding protein
MLRTIVTGAVIALGLATAPAKAADEINFGFISTEASTNLKARFNPWLEEMGKTTGLKINAFFASDYAGIIEAMRFNKVQVAWFGNASAIQAVDRANGEVFAQIIYTTGEQGYYSHIVVNKDSPYQKLDDILKCDKSIDFGIGDPNSTSGFLVPNTFIFAAKNITPKDCFKTVRSASHEANALATANKLVGAATNNSENMGRLEKTNPQAHAKLRIIWTSVLIPSDPLVWRKDLPEATKKKLTDFIIGYGNSGNAEVDAKAKEMLKTVDWGGFKKSDNSQLLPVRQMELTKEISKLQADDQIAEAEKTAKIAELKAKIAEIEKQIASKS